MSFHPVSSQPRTPRVFIDAGHLAVRHPHAEQVWVARAPATVTAVGATCDQSPLVVWWPTVMRRMHVVRRPDAASNLRAQPTATTRRAPVEACLP